MKKLPAPLLLGLAIAIVLDTALQIVWKASVAQLPVDMSTWAAIKGVATNPFFIGLLILMAGQFLNWIQLLGHADLSFAQPITSLSYISVLILSALYLGETVTLLQTAGVAFILVGVWFISQTDHKTEVPGISR